MNDLEYKQRFHALTVQLGRVPDTRDREWWGLTEELRRAWAGEGGALGEPRTAAINPEAATEPEAGNGAGTDYQGPILAALQATADAIRVPPTTYEGMPLARVGERGPGGGILARCVVCSRVWERPKSRGRPAYKCEECR